MIKLSDVKSEFGKQLISTRGKVPGKSAAQMLSDLKKKSQAPSVKTAEKMKAEYSPYKETKGNETKKQVDKAVGDSKPKGLNHGKAMQKVAEAIGVLKKTINFVKPELQIKNPVKRALDPNRKPGLVKLSQFLKV